MTKEDFQAIKQKHFEERLARANAQARKDNRKPLRPTKATKLDASTISFDFN
jgi:hypothetical protein